jgi:hypothetical protein
MTKSDVTAVSAVEQDGLHAKGDGHHQTLDDSEVEMQALTGKVKVDMLHDDDNLDDDDDLSDANPVTKAVGAIGPHGHALYSSYETETGFYRHLSPSMYNSLFPSNVPRACQLLRLENLAVPASYLLVGVLQGLSGPFINVYPLDLNASEAQQTTISGLRSLPASMKLAFGFWSDNFPFMGYRRKSFMLLGWLLSSLSILSLLTFSDLRLTKTDVDVLDDEGVVISTHEVFTASEDAPSIAFLSIMLLGFGTGFWCADVMADSVVAEKAKLEPEETRGQLQSTCYACRFFGLMCASFFSTYWYSRYGPQVVAGVMAFLPLIILPTVYLMYEPFNAPIKSTADQCGEIWKTVCSRAVWQPMGFVYLYGIMQIGNSAWREYLRSVLHFTSEQLNILLIVAYVLLYIGIMAYKCYFIRWSWRTIYISTTLLNGILSIGQIMLIQGMTFGLSPFVFALGDDAMADFIAGIQFLPTTIMMVHLCPSGSEGASYAMFTTMSNSAGTLAQAISTQLLPIWDVSKETMVGGDLSGMTKLTIFTTVVQTAAVLFVGLLPNSKEDLVALHGDGYSGSKLGGFIFLSVTLSSIVYAVGVGILNIVAPGWAGES